MDVFSLHSRAYEAFQQGMYDQAIGYLDQILAIDPNDVDALGEKDIVLDALGRFEEAIQYFDRVLAIDPNHILSLDAKEAAREALQNPFRLFG
jgi:tetratricopeptide (TPR) repeat protein